MPADQSTAIETSASAAWVAAQQDLHTAGANLTEALPGVARQPAFDRFVRAQQRCTDLIHTWLATAMQLEPVMDPRLVLSLDVDGTLEEEAEFSSTSQVGVAALRLLQLGGVAVVLNTARSLVDVRIRVARFRLLGGVAEMGASAWDGVASEESRILHEGPIGELNRLRAILRTDSTLVLETQRQCSVRATRIVEGSLRAIPGSEARRLLDEHHLGDLTFWVAPRHTDFVHRSVDKGVGINHLRTEMRLTNLPMAAMGDATCDLPMLRIATSTFLPAATLPSYVASPRQSLVRSRFLGDAALWDAACRLVPKSSLHRAVIEQAAAVAVPTWFPAELRRRPTSSPGILPRIAAAVGSVRTSFRERY